MARLVVGEDNLMLRLTWLEKVAAFRRSVTVPLAAIESVEVIDKPWNGLLGKEVSMGFAAGGAPGRTLITAGPRARTADGGEVVVFVYGNRRSVVVRTQQDTRPRMIVASSRTPDDDARLIQGNAAR